MYAPKRNDITQWHKHTNMSQPGNMYRLEKAAGCRHTLRTVAYLEIRKGDFFGRINTHCISFEYVCSAGD